MAQKTCVKGHSRKGSDVKAHKRRPTTVCEHQRNAPQKENRTMPTEIMVKAENVTETKQLATPIKLKTETVSKTKNRTNTKMPKTKTVGKTTRKTKRKTPSKKKTSTPKNEKQRDKNGQSIKHSDDACERQQDGYLKEISDWIIGRGEYESWSSWFWGEDTDSENNCPGYLESWSNWAFGNK